MGDPNGDRQRQALIREFEEYGLEHLLFLSAIAGARSCKTVRLYAASLPRAAWLAVRGANHRGGRWVER